MIFNRIQLFEAVYSLLIPFKACIVKIIVYHLSQLLILRVSIFRNLYKGFDKCPNSMDRINFSINSFTLPDIFTIHFENPFLLLLFINFDLLENH